MHRAERFPITGIARRLGLVLSHVLVAVVGAVVTVVGDAVGYGVAFGLLVGVVVVAWLSRRIMATLAALSEGVHQIAAGRYGVVVAEPAEREPAALAADVNALAGELGRTEQRRPQVMGEVAYEMRTPLAVLDGDVEGLQDGVFDPVSELYAELSAERRRLRRLSEDLSGAPGTPLHL